MKHFRDCNLTLITAAVFILNGLLFLVVMAGIIYYWNVSIGSIASVIVFKILPLLVSLFALYVACTIPFRIMQNQLYVDLMREYRSETMLQNIDRILAACGDRGDYSRCDCCTCNVEDNIRHGKDLGIRKHQRQSVSQWYWQLAGLLFSRKYYGCSHKIRSLLKKDFTRHDSRIICIVYHLNLANDRWELEKSISKFTRRLGKLFRLSKKWKQCKEE